MLMMLKEGGSLLIDTIGNLPIDEDIDLLPEASAALAISFRVITNSLSVTQATNAKSRAIVMESIIEDED
tara:strand:+ start:83 stop:292 length:210 start_codon:yes stop_codon:yes gene_type:complete